jgi:streptogramin lyase
MLLPKRCLLAAALILMSGSGSALAAPLITEFPVTVRDRGPSAIAAAPDGKLWFTESAANALGVSTVGGSLSQWTGLSGPAQGITVGADGNLWITEPGAAKIARVTPAKVLSEYTAGLTANSAPTGITAGADGNLWFTEAANPGRIGRITPAGTITEFTAGLTANGAPTGITAGADGNLWFTEAAGSGRIGRITPAGAVTEFTTGLTANGALTGITAGPDGNLWFTEAANHGQIGRLVVSAARPAVSTESASAIAPTWATISGVADPNGAATTYHFDWGPTPAYGQRLPAVDASVESDNDDHVSQLLSGLVPGTVYHYRLVATNCGGCQPGTSYGEDLTFVTATVAPSPIGTGNPVSPSPSPSPSPVKVPPPARGRTAVAGTVSGSVLVRAPGSSVLAPLDASRDLPLGSLIDASHGTVRLTTAVDGHGRTQSATLWGGSFVIHQGAKHGMTTFALAGRLSCPAAAVHRSFLAVSATAGRRKPRRSLWATDNHGQYSTRGQNSVATVRGTVWDTVDTCAGTRTFVKRGLVSVRDLRRHTTVLVRAGHSYLARR